MTVIYDGITAPPIVAPMPPGAPVLLSEVQSFSLVAISLQGANGRLLPGIRAAWATIDDVTVTAVDIQYYPTAQPAAVITKTVPASQTVIILAEGLVSNTEYTVRTRLRTDPPRVIAWTAAETVMTDNITDEVEEFARWVAEEVARQSGAAFAAIDALREDFGQLIADQDAQNWLDKEEWGFQLTASAERVTASYTERITVVADEVAGIASQVVALQAELDNLDANVTFRTVTAISLPAGALAAYEAAAQVTDGVYTSRAAIMIAAYSNAGGTYSTFEAEADLFVLTRRVNGIRVSPFVSNASGIFIQGDLIVDGSITAPKLNVGTLSAIAGNVGTLTAGVIRSADGKVVLDLNAGTFRISS